MKVNLFSIVGLVAGLLAATSSGAATMAEVAQPAAVPAGAPDKSDVMFTSRWYRSNMYDAARSFHSTRLDWIYTTDSTVVEDARINGQHFVSIAIQGGPEDSPGSGTWTNGRVEDRFGDIIPAHLSGQAFLCIHKPEGRQIWMDQARGALDAGPDGLQVDADGFAAHVRWAGGCLCDDSCVAFSPYLWSTTSQADRTLWGITETDSADFFMRDFVNASGGWQSLHMGLRSRWSQFMISATQEFYKDWIPVLEAEYSRSIPFSCNNGTTWMSYQSEFDYSMGELTYAEAMPSNMYAAVLLARDGGVNSSFPAGRVQTFLQPKPPVDPAGDYVEVKDRALRAIALAYGMGTNLMVPWDTYLGASGGSAWTRYFGTPEEYAPMYAFVHAMADHLDGYEDAAAIGYDLDDSRYDPNTVPVVLSGGTGKTCAFVRAVPGGINADVVIHLVDDSTNPAPFTIAYENDAMFFDRDSTVKLYIPKPYVQGEHDAAYASGDYSGLKEEAVITVSPDASGNWTLVDVPALSNKWGVLVIEGEPWQGLYEGFGYGDVTDFAHNVANPNAAGGTGFSTAGWSQWNASAAGLISMAGSASIATPTGYGMDKTNGLMRVAGDTSATWALRNMAAGIAMNSGATYYFSVLIRNEDTAPSISDYASLSFRDGGTSPVSFGFNNDEKLQVRAGTTTAIGVDTVFAVGNNVTVVGKLQLSSTGDDTLSVSTFQDTDTIEGDPVSWDLTVTDELGSAVLDNIGCLVSSGNSAVAFDEFRLGGSFASVISGPPAPAIIVAGTAISSGVMKLIIHTPDAASYYFPKFTTNLVGGTWARVVHSDNPDTGFAVTNLGYSATDATGTNEVIYVQTTTSQGFFSIRTQ